MKQKPTITTKVNIISFFVKHFSHLLREFMKKVLLWFFFCLFINSKSHATASLVRLCRYILCFVFGYFFFSLFSHHFIVFFDKNNSTTVKEIKKKPKQTVPIFYLKIIYPFVLLFPEQPINFIENAIYLICKYLHEHFSSPICVRKLLKTMMALNENWLRLQKCMARHLFVSLFSIYNDKFWYTRT